MIRNAPELGTVWAQTCLLLNHLIRPSGDGADRTKAVARHDRPEDPSPV